MPSMSPTNKKSIGFLILAILVGIGLFVVVFPDLFDNDRPVAVQAVAAIATFIATVFLVIFSYQAEGRSERAEIGNAQTRDAVLEQAKQTERFAEAAHEQVAVLREQNTVLSNQLEQQRSPQLVLFQGAEGALRPLFIANLGNLPIQIVAMETQFGFLKMPFDYTPIFDERPDGVMGLKDVEVNSHGTGLLSPGEKKMILFPIDLADFKMPEHQGYRSFYMTIYFVYGPTGSVQQTKRFTIIQENIDDVHKIITERFPDRPWTED
ncbi:hypothetical protein E7T06_07445 [Deinococcus sp. Arct2-2]|uniref:hypothetical protein n=1 Tax=Deinococcus sp. Arct2-2 TaxID=2568653 RepID=UPI0010A3B8B5|nr:hypothetical protein [Deinococcus sp. Arct2-2]THF70530.1 hypothetical protein E7T06_07445 [Deinococcus sp. Arct2-2]